MIVLGLDSIAKDRVVADYSAANAVSKVFILSPERFRFTCTTPHDSVEWAEIIKYQHYYRLLREIGRDTLIVVNECLRTQNRHELTYNCIRLFLQQTTHQIVFQYLPMIDSVDDFMILLDFDTRSQWKREPFRPELLAKSDIKARRVAVEFIERPVTTDQKTKEAYAREKRKLIDGIGLKDPHTIPRNLYLMSGRAKLPHVVPGARYVGRNNRFKMENINTYREATGAGERVVFEFPHNFIDFADFLAVSQQSRVEALVADLKVDHWYFARYEAWAGRLHEAYSVISREDDCP